MNTPPPITEADLAAIPPAVLALLHWQAQRIDQMMGQAGKLSKRIEELEARLVLPPASPANSSKPPSATHAHAKPPSAKPKSKRRRGRQPGHENTNGP